MNNHLYNDGLRGNFKDMCIITLDGEIWAHKAFLGTAFKFFKNFFETEGEDQVVCNTNESSDNDDKGKSKEKKKDKGKNKESKEDSICQIDRCNDGSYAVLVAKSYASVNLLMRCVYSTKIDSIINYVDDDKSSILLDVLDLYLLWDPEPYFRALFSVWYEKEIMDSIVINSHKTRWYDVILIPNHQNLVTERDIGAKLLEYLTKNENKTRYSYLWNGNYNASSISTTSVSSTNTTDASTTTPTTTTTTTTST